MKLVVDTSQIELTSRDSIIYSCKQGNLKGRFMAWGDYKNLRNTTKYKGFRITPCSTFSIEDDGLEKWNIAAEIGRVGGNVPARIFLRKGRSAASEKDAVLLSQEYAENIIDGLVPGESVADL